jgi:serine/threonine protein kinase
MVATTKVEDAVDENNDQENEPTQRLGSSSLDGFQLETIPREGAPPMSDRARVRQIDVSLPVSDRYKLAQLLGEGGMATVYVAADQLLGRDVAVKCIKSDLKGDDDASIRFHDEAKIMSMLDHPGAVPVHDLGKLADGRWFLAMKRVRGQTLKELLAKRTPDEIADRSTLLRFVDLYERVCQTVAAAHAQRVIHRDLKPENVMIDDFGAVYVMDWGLSKILPEEGSLDRTDSGRTVKGVILGTPAYMAPEQARGTTNTSERQADVFSLGVMLYEILTGNRPFAGLTWRETLDQVMNSDPPNPRSLNPSLPRDLAEICMKAIAKDPTKRYASAKDLADDIARYRQFLPVTAARPRLFDRIAAWSRRNPRIAGASATAVILVLMVGLWTAARVIEERNRISAAFERIDALQKTVAYLDDRISTTVETLSKTPVNAPDRAMIERQLAEIRSIRRLEEELIRSTAFAVIGATVVEPDTRAQKLLRDEFRKEVSRAIDTGDDVLARTLLAHMLATQQQRNVFGFDEADTAWMNSKREEIEARIRAKGEKVPELPSFEPGH